MHDVPAAASEVRRIAGAGLAPAEPVTVASGRWPIVLSGLDFHRLTGIALTAYESGNLVLPEEQVEDLLVHHRSAMVQALSIERRLLRLIGAFYAAGVRAVVLKGTAVAHAVYPDPTMRPFGDLDLLVAASAWRTACEVLRAEGYRRDLPEPRPGFDERFGKAATHSDAEGVQVDLHRTLVLGPFGLWLDPDELLESTETFELAGRRIERLDRTGLLLNAALHAGLGSAAPLLLPLRDVAEASGHPGVDWDRLAAWAERWRVRPALARAFEIAERSLAWEPPAPAREISARPAGRAEGRAIRAYTERRRVGGMALAAMRAIPGLRAKTLYLYGLLLPSREFLRARGRPSYVARWRVPAGWVRRQLRHR
jgi:hypothetical protein